MYLLWAYQRVFFGPVTQDINRHLPDADRREKVLLTVFAALILFMGIGSVAFTSRTEASAQHTLDLMRRPQAYNAAAHLPPRPLAALPVAKPVSEAR